MSVICQWAAAPNVLIIGTRLVATASNIVQASSERQATAPQTASESRASLQSLRHALQITPASADVQMNVSWRRHHRQQHVLYHELIWRQVTLPFVKPMPSSLPCAPANNAVRELRPLPAPEPLPLLVGPQASYRFLHGARRASAAAWVLSRLPTIRVPLASR